MRPLSEPVIDIIIRKYVDPGRANWWAEEEEQFLDRPDETIAELRHQIATKGLIEMGIGYDQPAKEIDFPDPFDRRVFREDPLWLRNQRKARELLRYLQGELNL